MRGGRRERETDRRTDGQTDGCLACPGAPIDSGETYRHRRRSVQEQFQADRGDLLCRGFEVDAACRPRGCEVLVDHPLAHAAPHLFQLLAHELHVLEVGDQLPHDAAVQRAEHLGGNRLLLLGGGGAHHESFCRVGLTNERTNVTRARKGSRSHSVPCLPDPVKKASSRRLTDESGRDSRKFV